MPGKLRSPSLYKCAINAIVANYSKVRSDFIYLPKDVLFDVYYQLYLTENLCHLGIELKNLEAFYKVLQVKSRRHHLRHCFQALMNDGIGISELLAQAYEYQALILSSLKCSSCEKENFIQLGIQLGSFLNECGWLKHSQEVFTACLSMCCSSGEDPKCLLTKLNCCHGLLYASRKYCNFTCAQRSYELSLRIIDQLDSFGAQLNKASLYTEFSGYYFDKSEFHKSYEWAQKALQELNSSLPPQIIIDTLRQACVAYVVLRKYDKAKILIRQAYSWGKKYLNDDSLKLADLLTDYAFYFLSVDYSEESVTLYMEALSIRRNSFDGLNLYVALSHEHLAYASYINEYSHGSFSYAEEHSDQALKMMTTLLPEDHLLLASSKRVKALIIEEMAVEDSSRESRALSLAIAQELHFSALESTQKVFGDVHVQTAKYYGNIGRLYQSMSRYEEAEQMFLKALAIKELLLGPEDNEVALSVGHLASLYCYELKQYAKAEQLYLRSIKLGIKLFGEDYSGLQYDYNGLLRVYSNLNNIDKVNYYFTLLSEWRHLRCRRNAQTEFIPSPEAIRSIEDILLMTCKD